MVIDLTQLTLYNVCIKDIDTIYRGIYYEQAISKYKPSGFPEKISD